MPEPVTDGEEALKQIEGELLALGEVPGRLLPLDMEGVVEGVQAGLDDMEANLETILRPLTTPVQEEVRGALGKVRVVLTATGYVKERRDRQVLETSELHEKVAEASPLRRNGLRNLGVLEGAGFVTSAQAQAIRAGTGHADTAGDLVALGPLLKEHWAVLEPLQAARLDPAERLTVESIARMVPLGAEIQKADREQRPKAGEPDWRALLLRCQALLTQLWDRLRYLAVGMYGWDKQFAKAAEGYPTLRALGR